jgi:hypothetical protein
VITEKISHYTGSSKILTRSLISINATQVNNKIIPNTRKNSLTQFFYMFENGNSNVTILFICKIKIRISRHVIKFIPTILQAKYLKISIGIQ